MKMTDRRVRVITDTKVPPSPCCNCGKIQGAAANIDGHYPHAGAYSLCLDCGHIMVFDDALRLRNPTEQEMSKIAGDRNLIEMQKFRANYHKGRK
jgi:hypothetical protein